MLDKQVYRDAETLDEGMLNTILNHYQNVAKMFKVRCFDNVSLPNSIPGCHHAESSTTNSHRHGLAE